ncbi:hypothetical protein [Haladaptatus caseinilyticus]|uniref:hypothetical protein n=1 Tax=Haladaptatus caseinilyticus TaxID=2993314 RepID=UPI00224B9DF8|nr:hypothetical protein [Haladaptatus caseinilyticus]
MHTDWGGTEGWVVPLERADEPANSILATLKPTDERQQRDECTRDHTERTFPVEKCTNRHETTDRTVREQQFSVDATKSNPSTEMFYVRT